MGHLHFITANAEGARRFWLAMGGTPVQNGSLELIQFPGVFVMLTTGSPAGGTVGSVTNHIGFQVKNIQQSVAMWKAAGLKLDPGSRPTQVFVTSPDEIRIEILEDQSLDVPIVMHHVHLFTPAPTESQQWYVKTFGATAAHVGPNDAAVLPGVNVLFAPGTDSAPSRGRALDHIGFEVANLEAFCRKLQASGIRFERPFERTPGSTLAVASFTDPWGTSIELTENLAPRR